MSKEAMKLALEKFANAKALCDKHGDKINRKHVYGGALIEHFDVVCQALAEQPAQQEPVACERCLELERLCDATYVAQGADAYNHACDEMERWQQTRQKAGKEVGTTGSLCDGISWLYGHIDELEAKVATPPAQRKYCRGDRLICLETEEYCVIHISGTDRQWVKFPDTHIGVYKNEQLAELFELLPKEIEIEQPASKPWVGLEPGEISKIATSDPLAWANLNTVENRQYFARAIEAKLKEKNT